jgi:hypothetical protein
MLLCVLMPLDMCPHATRYALPHPTIYVSLNWVRSRCRHTTMCPHDTRYVSTCPYVCVLILPYICPHTNVCPHTTKYVSSCRYICPNTTVYTFSYYYMCVLMPLYMSSSYDICVLELGSEQERIWLRNTAIYGCPHTNIYVTHTTIYVSLNRP